MTERTKEKSSGTGAQGVCFYPLVLRQRNWERLHYEGKSGEGLVLNLDRRRRSI